MCGGCRLVSSSLPKPHQTPGAHSRALSTTSQSSSKFKLLLSLNLGNKIPGSPGKLPLECLALSPQTAAFTRRAPGWDDTAGHHPQVCAQNTTERTFNRHHTGYLLTEHKTYFSSLFNRPHLLKRVTALSTQDSTLQCAG